MTVVIRRHGRCAFTVDAHAIAAEHLSAAGASGSGVPWFRALRHYVWPGTMLRRLPVWLNSRFPWYSFARQGRARMGRNHLAGSHGDDANAVLAAADYNFRSLLEWVALLLSLILAAINAANGHERRLKLA